MATESICYWLFDENCVCPRLHGYVGITINFPKRLIRHIKSDRHPPGFKHAILFSGSREEVLALEARLRPIPHIGWNVAQGGKFLGAALLGSKKTEEHKKKIAAAHLGIRPDVKTRKIISVNRRGKALGNQNAKGLVHTDEQKLKWSVERKGNQHWKKRKPYSVETLQKIGQGSIDAWNRDPGRRERNSQLKKEWWKTPAGLKRKAEMAKQNQTRIYSEIERAATVERNKNRVWTEEMRRAVARTRRKENTQDNQP